MRSRGFQEQKRSVPSFATRSLLRKENPRGKMAVFRQKGLKIVLPKTTISQSWQRSSRRLEDLQGTQGER